MAVLHAALPHSVDRDVLLEQVQKRIAEIEATPAAVDLVKVREADLCLDDIYVEGISKMQKGQPIVLYCSCIRRPNMPK